MAQPHEHAHAQATRDARHTANNNGAEHRDGWRPKSLVAEHRRWSSEHGQTPVHESVPATWKRSVVANYGRSPTEQRYVPQQSTIVHGSDVLTSRQL